MNKKLLVVVDMQNDFVTGALGTKEAQKVVDGIAKKILSAKLSGTEVAFTRDTHEQNYLATQEGKNLPVVHCVEGTDGWQIVPELAPYAKEIFDKPCFGSVKLAEYVKKQGFSEVELVGVCTDICVVSNALLIKAYCPETPVVVDSSCCAGVTPESHAHALETMKSCQVKIK